MMKKQGIKLGLFMMISVLSLCVIVPPAAALSGGKVEDFSADSVTIDPSGNVVNTGKIYVSGAVTRVDGIGGMMGRGMGGKAPDMSILTFKNQKTMYFYNHDKKLVYQGALEEEDMLPGYKAMGNVTSEKVLGEENVSGYKCVKKEIVTSTNIMGMNHTTKLTVWESDRFEAPLRTMTDDGGINELRNIKEGKPSAKLLKPVPGYKKVGNMMAVMGMDFGGMMD